MKMTTVELSFIDADDNIYVEDGEFTANYTIEDWDTNDATMEVKTLASLLSGRAKLTFRAEMEIMTIDRICADGSSAYAVANLEKMLN